MTKRALVPIADGTEEIEAVCIVDTLRRAGVEVTVASVMGRPQVTASRQTKLVADTLIESVVDDVFDLIALPGGIPGAEHLRDCEQLIRILRVHGGAGRLYGAICASPAVVLFPHGLLSGRSATCHPSYLDSLSEADGVEAVEERVVVDGNVVTSRGPGTAIEFALKLIEVLFWDADRARALGDGMLVVRP